MHSHDAPNIAWMLAIPHIFCKCKRKSVRAIGQGFMRTWSISKHDRQRYREIGNEVLIVIVIWITGTGDEKLSVKKYGGIRSVELGNMMTDKDTSFMGL